MKQAFLTVDCGFGDSSKGACTDFLVREFDCDLVVRYSGGYQAGHNVQLPDGTRFKFSQFGSGTFAGARTYLGPEMIINPPALMAEARGLVKAGLKNTPLDMIRIHPDCLVATNYHIAMNHIREESRSERHGSCGLGIGETREYWLTHGHDAICLDDCGDPDKLYPKLRLLRERLIDEVRGSDKFRISEPNNFLDWNLFDEVDELIQNSSLLSPLRTTPVHRSVVYEASQGVLLDQTYGFHPHTTWSDVTLKPALELVNQDRYDKITKLGITRAYTARHGNGPLPTYSKELTERCIDPGNPQNDWQGSMRMGWLDLPLLDYAISNCGAKLDGLIVNHLDQLPGNAKICTQYDMQVCHVGPLQQFVTTGVPQVFPSIQNQSTLSNHLYCVAPVLKQTDASSLINRLRERLAIFAVGHGPTHQDRGLL